LREKLFCGISPKSPIKEGLNGWGTRIRTWVGGVREYKVTK